MHSGRELIKPATKEVVGTEVSAQSERLEEFMDYRQVPEWIQKHLGKVIPPNLPNRINLEKEKQGAE